MIKHETHTRRELGDDSNVEFGLEGDCCQNLIKESGQTFTIHTFLDASHLANQHSAFHFKRTPLF